MCHSFQCLQFRTEHAQDVKKVEKLVSQLMRHMASKESVKWWMTFSDLSIDLLGWIDVATMFNCICRWQLRTKTTVFFVYHLNLDAWKSLMYNRNEVLVPFCTLFLHVSKWMCNVYWKRTRGKKAFHYNCHVSRLFVYNNNSSCKQ